MSKWKPTPLRRSLQPMAEGLETRELSRCYRTATGPQGCADPGGDRRRAGAWIRTGPSGRCRCMGPGRSTWSGPTATSSRARPAPCRNRSTPSPWRARSRRRPAWSRTVYPNPSTQNAKVYFQNLIVTPTGELGKIDEGQVSNFRTVPERHPRRRHARLLSGSYRDDQTERSRRRFTRPPCRPVRSYIPQGVITLRFGGVDVDYTPPGGIPLNTTAQSNEFQITLGLPVVQGTSVIVNTVNSDGEANSTARSPAFQDFATFLVTGRLNLFQANEIDGNTTSGLVPTQLVNSTVEHRAFAGRHVCDLARWCGHRPDRQRPRRRQRHQLHDVRDRRSAQRGRRRKGSSTPRSATTTSAARPITFSWSPPPAREISRSGSAWIT